MEFFRRAEHPASRLGIMPGTFNPVTVAHLALARAALDSVDEVLFVLPRIFPHKQYAGATFAERIEMLRTAVAQDRQFSIATTEGGLFLEIAEECRGAYGPEVRLSFLCGRDAAERIVAWDYGDSRIAAEMLRSFDLLVASRNGEYSAPDELAHAIQPLTVPETLDHISATEVRRRIACGEPWEPFVPTAIQEQIRRIYAR